MTTQNQPNKAVIRTAIVAVGVAFIVIILGAFTRLSDAGLGCPDWPTCYGHALWPKTSEEISQANISFPHAPVEKDKTWPEMVHRYFATSIGLFCIVLVALSIKERKKQPAPLAHTLFLLCLVLLQGAFGAWTVTLKLWPQVVTAHLLGGFATLSVLWLLVLRLRNSPWQLSKEVFTQVKTLRRFAAVCLVMVILQIALGGWTTSNYAALACPDLPACQGQWLPAMDFRSGFNVTQKIGPSYLGGVMDNNARVAIHFSHRVGAIVTSVLLLVLGSLLIKSGDRNLARMGCIVCGVLLCQVFLGLSNVHFLLPLPVAVAHNAGGALLLLVMITLNYLLYSAQAIHSD